MSELKLEAKEGIDQETINSVKSLGESYMVSLLILIWSMLQKDFQKKLSN